MVAVEASPGHDIGEVTMVGRLVDRQMKRANIRPDTELKRVFRKARPSDLEKYEEAKAKEHDTMIRSRKIAESLSLDMKIGDVEYQGDGGKAIFYYIADERVDFRKLIRVLADTFKVRIEMRQIGARQEAGRIGGIGPCGRPLCCSSWMTHFVSVGTSAARFQDLSMNPQKLAGQCAKLKCCLNFEVDIYMESQRKLPSKDIVLQTKEKEYFLVKTDPLTRKVTYSTDKSSLTNAITIDARRAFEIITLNRQGVKPDILEATSTDKGERKEFVDLVGQDSLTRFDRSKKRRKKRAQVSRQDADTVSEETNNQQKQGGDRPGKAKPLQSNVANEGNRNSRRQHNRRQNSAANQQGHKESNDSKRQSVKPTDSE
jgi:cell fate regulator YaaT (PSP1 superfamily)